jgi:hypothetical protein
VHPWEALCQSGQFGHDTGTVAPDEPFGGTAPRRRREQTEPDLAGLRTFREETRELGEIPRAQNLLSSDGAVHNHLLLRKGPRDVYYTPTMVPTDKQVAFWFL